MVEVGYIVDCSLVIVIYFLLKFGKLFFFEGEFGVGKIEVVKVLGSVFGCLFVWL